MKKIKNSLNNYYFYDILFYFTLYLRFIFNKAILYLNLDIKIYLKY